MSGFTKSIKDEIHFDGDTIRFVMCRLTRADLMEFSRFSNTGSDGQTRISFADQIEMMGLAAKMLPRYILEFEGLYDASGAPLCLEDALEESYFIGLLSALLERLMTASTPDGDDQKNFDGQPENTSGGTEP